MNFSTLSKTGLAASLLCAALAGGSAGAQAGTLQDTIFAKVDTASTNRMFVRLSHINVNVKTTSKDAYDVTGPVLGANDFDLLASATSAFVDVEGNSLDGSVYGDSVILTGYQTGLKGYPTTCPSLANGLGTPCGIKAKSASRVSTEAVSLGYYLDTTRNWAIEAFVLAAPVSAVVYGDGATQLRGKQIIDTKLLPPIVTLGRYFGSAEGGFRPYLGAAISYAVFYDTRASSVLNAFQGGRSEGDTTVKIDNSFGWGPMVGLSLVPKSSDWSFGVSVGKIRYKANATLTTRNTTITDASGVLSDYPVLVRNSINLLRRNYGDVEVNTGETIGGYVAGDKVPVVTALMCDLARVKYQNNDCNQGTFVRKAQTTLDNTMVMFNVAKSF